MPPTFVNCDWGTTRLRMRAVRTQPWQIATEFRSLDGIASVAEHYGPAERPHAFAAILAEGMQPLVAGEGLALADAPIAISGMASSSLGWCELPYAALPLAVDGSGLVWRELPPVASSLSQHRVILISGVRSQSDVMRGEETELVGLFTLPEVRELAGSVLVIKPGTHSKHLTVQDGNLIEFQTHMTGELFAVLSKHSILQHSVAEADKDEISTSDFVAGVEHARGLPLSAALFRVRTRQVLDAVQPKPNRSFLSGVLIGSELAPLANLAESIPLVLAASRPVATLYKVALQQLDLAGRLVVIAPDEVESLSARGQARLLEVIDASK